MDCSNVLNIGRILYSSALLNSGAALSLLSSSGPTLSCNPRSFLVCRSLANDVCSVTEAKTIYPLMGISANVALVFAGKLIKFVNRTIANGSSLMSYRCLVGIVVIGSCIMMAAKLFLDHACPDTQQVEDSGKPKAKKSFKDGLAVLKESPKILNLALLVIGYSISHRFFEVVWKGQLKVVYPTQQAYQGILADVSVWTGMATVTLMLTGKFVFQVLPSLGIFGGCV